MIAYRCDQCQKFVEGYPANEGLLLQPNNPNPIEEMNVKATVYLRGFRGKPHEAYLSDTHLCPECFIKDLEAFIELYETSGIV